MILDLCKQARFFTLKQLVGVAKTIPFSFFEPKVVQLPLVVQSEGALVMDSNGTFGSSYLE